jgi:hypothetical protein
MMKLKCIYILAVAFLVCSSYNFQIEDIRVVGATCRRSRNGINRGGYESEYLLKTVILSSKRIEFDSLWMHNKPLKTYLASNRKGISNAPITFSMGDTVTVMATDGDDSAIKAPQNNYLPKYKGDAILRYFVDGKPFYIEVKKFKEVDFYNRQ